MFDKFIEALIGAFIVGLIASFFFSNVILALAAAAGITGIGAGELAGAAAFVVIIIYKLFREKSSDSDD